MHDKYDMIFSLGSNCGCARLMEYEGMRTFAGPFDWIRNNKGGFCLCFDFLLNGFKRFLELDDLETTDKTEDPLYVSVVNRGNGYDFLHDFPIGRPIAETFAEVRQKYKRRIDRFYRLITERKRVLLIWYSYTFNTPDDDVIRLCGEFCQKMNKTIDFLIIEHTEGLYQPLKRQITDNIVRYNCHATAKQKTNPYDVWMGNRKLVQPIFAQYKLCVSWPIAFGYAIAKPMILFASNFLFTKDARKRFREKMFKKLKIPEGKR